tara:strand:- start:63 stop:353 length:291 start_codon:yes stop_codon:yes gene_type:complete
MNKKLEWYIIIFLVIVLVGLSSCSPSPHVDKQSPHETEEEMNAEITKDMDAMDKEKELLNSDGPTNFEGIAHALACMFAPDECPAKKSKEEKKMDR